MKTSRAIALIAAVSSVVLIAIGVYDLANQAGPPAPAAFARGESLAVKGLKSGERIEVFKLLYPDRGQAVARNYIITGGDFRRFETVVLATAKPGEFPPIPDQKFEPISLSTEQEEGLDAVLTFLRQRHDVGTFSRSEYHYAFYRDGKLIGESLVYGSFLTRELTLLALENPRKDPGFDSDYARLAKESEWSKESLKRLVTFEMLEEQSRRSNP